MLHYGRCKNRRWRDGRSLLRTVVQANAATALSVKKISETKVVICRQRRKLCLWFLRLALKRNNKLVAIVQVKENQL